MKKLKIIYLIGIIVILTLKECFAAKEVAPVKFNPIEKSNANINAAFVPKTSLSRLWWAQKNVPNKQQPLLIKDAITNQKTIKQNIEPTTTKIMQQENNLQMVVYKPQENTQAPLTRSGQRQLQEINNTKNLELVTYDPQQRSQYKLTTEPTILSKDAAIESKLQYDLNGNPIIMDNAGIARQIQYDIILKNYYVQGKNGREYLDATIEIPSDAHQKIMNAQQAEIKNLQEIILENAQKAPVVKTISEKLSNLWNNTKAPTTAEIKNALNTIFTKIQDTFRITISDPIRKTLFKEAVDTLPKDKDPKKINSWSLSLQKSMYRTTLKFLTSTLDARAKDELNIYQDVADLSREKQTEYLSLKYSTYISGFEMYTKLYESVPDIANSLSSAILKDVKADRSLTPKDIHILQNKFIQKFVDWNSSDAPKLEQAYKTLNIEPTTDEATIKKAYYKLARERHPDQNGNVKDFQTLKEAYDLILEKKDAQKSTPQEEMVKKIEKFQNLMNDFLVDIYTQQAAIRQAHEPLKNMVLEKLDQSFALVPDENDPIIKDLTYSVKELGKYLSNKRAKQKQLEALKIIIEDGISKNNPNGTVTYSRKGHWSQETSTITVDKQGNIVSMKNVTDSTW